MTCPVHGNGPTNRAGKDGKPADGEPTRDRQSSEKRGIDRRELMKSALMIGGTSALSTITGLYGLPETAKASRAKRPVTIAERENRQHAWDAYETFVEARGQSVPPAHHLLLHANYTRKGEPTSGHRRKVSETFKQLEEAFGWDHNGILFTVGYSPEYFDRFEEDLPEGLNPESGSDKPGLLRVKDLLETPGVTLDSEDPVADTYDVCIHLSSDHVQNLLEAEAALWGERKRIDGVKFASNLKGIFTKPEAYPERRVGFVGYENIVEKLDAETDVDSSPIPGRSGEAQSDLMMGFNGLYENSVPRETNATLLEDQQLVVPKPPGMFAQGTIEHVSKLDVKLSEWYGTKDADERRKQMLSPSHTEENTGVVGENLGTSNAPGETPMRRLNSDDDDIAEQTVDDYRKKGMTGHAQKVARARFDLESRITDEGRTRLSGGEGLLPADEREDQLSGHDGNQEAEQIVLRRDVTTTDQSMPGNHFVALMRFNPYMGYLRQAMNGVEFDSAAFALTGENHLQHDAVGADENSGIVNFLETQRRGNYLVPPITLRALPHSCAREVSISVSKQGSTYVVESSDLKRNKVDPDTVRFGWFYDVNRGRGASPTSISKKGGSLTMEFPASETGIDSAPGGSDGDVRVRLFAKQNGSQRPLWGTETVMPD